MNNIRFDHLAEFLALTLSLATFGCGGDPAQDGNTLPEQIALTGTYRLTNAACSAGTPYVTSGLKITFSNSSLTSAYSLTSSCTQTEVFSLSSFTNNSFTATGGPVTCSQSCGASCQEGQGEGSIDVNYTVSGSTLVTTERSANGNCSVPTGKITSTYTKQL